MGVRRNFSRGGRKVDIFLIFFRFWRCNTNGCRLYQKKMFGVTVTVAYSDFLVRKLYSEQMFVLVSMDFLRLS